ncbi:NACHT domain-containing protein [Clostridium sp. Marseille-Q7071]
MNYEWIRYWYLIDKSIRYDNGYVAEKDSFYKNENLFKFDEIANIHLLILLGEPGMGKSYELKNEYTKCIKNNSNAIYVDLSVITESSELDKEIFEEPRMKDLAQSRGSDVHIFLDSFDECLMVYKNLPKVLIKKFSKLKVPVLEKVKLRIACRNGMWIMAFKNDFENLWGTENSSIYQLAPLTKCDVVEALSKNNIDNNQGFIKDIERLNIQSMAIRPVTLNFLIKEFCKKNSLSNSKIELYEQGCLLLCEEVNDSRRKHRFNIKLTPQDKLEFSSKIAVQMLFTNSYIINDEVEQFRINDEKIPLRLIRGNLRDDELEEILSTGLFITSNQNEYKWSHLSYMEFLAARFLNKNLGYIQKINLLTHNKITNKIPPQLHHTAAWLSTMNGEEEIFRYLMKNDYDILFLSDLAVVKDRLKMEFLEILLDEYANNSNFRYNNYLYYSNLNYQGIENYIRKFILNPNKDEKTKRVAIRVAIQCNIKGIKNNLLDVMYTHEKYLQEDALDAFFVFFKFERFDSVKYIYS